MEKKLLILLILILLCYNVKAVNIGISPATISFQNVLRNGYSERKVIVSTDSIKPVEVTIKTRGEIAEWLKFSEKNFTISKNKTHILTISINPPADIPNGNYTGFVRFSTGSLGGEGVEGHATGIVRATVDLAIKVEITDIEIVECSVSNFEVQSVEKGDDIIFSGEVTNKGNIRLRPQIKIDIWDKEQISIVKSKEFIGDEILPTRKGNLTLRIPSNELNTDQYWAEVSVIQCYFSKLLTFDILEPGVLKAEGKLLGIVTKREAEAGETVPIIAKFKNTGEKELDAQFKGKVTKEGKIIQLLESEIFKVPIGQTFDFTLYFTPTKEGKYIISGRVFYNNKRTFELSAVLNVLSKKFKLKNLLIIFAYLVLAVLIGFLLYKIRKEKKKLSLYLKNKWKRGKWNKKQS